MRRGRGCIQDIIDESGVGEWGKSRMMPGFGA